MNLTFKENMLTSDLQSNPKFFKFFQQLDMIVRTLHMFEEIEPILDKEDDSFYLEWDIEVEQHLLLHKSVKFNETRPICYIDKEKFPMKTYHSFIISCLREAWVEYEV